MRQLFNAKVLDRILLLMKLYQRVLHLEQFHVGERKRGRSRKGRKKREADSKGRRINLDRPQAAGEAI